MRDAESLLGKPLEQKEADHGTLIRWISGSVLRRRSMRAKAPECQIAKRFRVSVSFCHPTAPETSGRRHPGPQASRRRAAAGPRFPRTGTTGDADRRASRCHLEPIEGVGRLRLHPDDHSGHTPPVPPDYKKKTLHASERDDPKVQAKRRRYRQEVEQIDAKRLVFVDETGINTAMTPTHAWARRGKRAIGSVPPRGVRRR